MILKALMAGLTGVSLCMANITGIVTDSGTTPISGVVVRLEKGGWTATTGSDGRFSLGASTGIVHGKNISLPNGLFAEITGNLMTVTVAQPAVVEVSAVDLSGKVLSNVRLTKGTDIQTIALPQRRAGVYLYRVKSGNQEFILKGNLVRGVSSGSVGDAQSSSQKHLTKQAMNTAAISDIIAATKTGYLNYRVNITNSDTNDISIKMIASTGTLKDADGNIYQTVKIGNQIWMAENFRSTKYNDSSTIPLVMSKTTWDACTIPAFCYYNNTVNVDSIKRFGALYNWYAVNTGKLAPTGWHVPDTTDWAILETYLISNGYNWDGTTMGNKVAKSLAAKTDWRIESDPLQGTISYIMASNNRSGFSSLPSGSRFIQGDFVNFDFNCYYWSTTEYDGARGYCRSLCCEDQSLALYNITKSFGFSVRLIKD